MNPPLRFKAGGTLTEEHFYVERAADQALPAALLRGEFCYVLAPRQMGKSSLRYRVARSLQTDHGVPSATVDLTGLGGTTATPDTWYFGIVDDIARQLGGEALRTETEEFWETHGKLPIVQRFLRLVRELLLVRVAGRMVLFVDEIDAVRALPFGSDDFFAAVRALYNARPDDPEYERLSVCLLGVAQPGDLIRNEQITPFNIGRRIDLLDFDRAELVGLRTGLLPTGANPDALLDAIFDWTHGHPYMVQSLCAALVPRDQRPQAIGAGEEAAQLVGWVEKLFLRRSEERNANLAYAEKAFQRGNQDPRVAKMLALYARLHRGEVVAVDGRDPIQGALQLTGMAAVRAVSDGRVLHVRNRIFATFFDATWVRTQQAERTLTEPLARWLDGRRADDFVLRGQALRAAEAWADGRIDITSEEQEFLRACWRVQSAEEQARAEAAQREATAANAQIDLERAAREKAQAETEIERLERAKAKAEQERAEAAAQVRMRSRTTALLAVLLVAAGAAIAGTYWQYRKILRAEQDTAKALVLAQQARAQADELTLIERGGRAKLLAQIPGELEGLTTGLLAVGPGLKAPQRVPAQVMDGLVSAAQARGYPLLPPWKHEKPVSTASHSPDGTRVVTASSDGTARLWDAQTGASVATLKGHTRAVFAASHSPDGTRVVTASEDGTARLWDAQTGASVATLKGHTEAVLAASYSPDGTRVVTASSDGTARLWDAQTGASVATLKGHTNGVVVGSYSPDGTRVVTASADGTARLWDAQTGASVATLKGHTNFVRAASYSPDGTRVVTASNDGTARLWDAQTGASVATLKGHEGVVFAASYSPDGTRVVTASADGTTRLWDAQTGASVATLKGYTGVVLAAGYSPDGTRVVTASADGTARLWDAQTGASVATLKGHTRAVVAASYSPDGTRVVTASSDGTARLWDAQSGASVATLKGHTGVVVAASHSPDGTRVVTASSDGTARLWDAKTGASVATFADHQGKVFAATFSPDGTRIVTAGEDGLARIYSTQLSDYVVRACELLSGHPDLFAEVADVCRQVGGTRAPSR